MLFDCFVFTMRLLSHRSDSRSIWNFAVVAGILLLCFFLDSGSASALRYDRRALPPSSPAKEALLFKRGNCCSSTRKATPTNHGPPYASDPSVDDLKADIAALGTVAGKRSIFYTGLGGANAQGLVSSWACGAIDPNGANFVIFRTLFPDDYINQKLVNIAGSAASIDLWGKRASWAWAELAEGDTYIAIPDGATPAASSTWVLYEYPALQRNGNVGNIIRVDPSTGATSTIWTQGSAIDTPEPGPQQRSGPPI